MSKVASLLIVDDNQMDTILTMKILEKSGHFEHVYAVTDGREALELFRNYEDSCRSHPERFPPTMILLDINMPLMNGFEFLEEFSRLDKGTESTSVVVLLTSSSYPVDRERAMQYSAVKDYVVKPMNKTRARELAEKFGVASDGDPQV